ncbi:lipopolysaccharide biosynthesis protein [Streptococcus sp. S784/96/1]|uniref:lipopolysaccharide biosynthesis protein n=1 Tax=Streptococcus sp. S784/96/1 TaxID=2653499 RepID=UPI001386D726|nr:oligosaccharide flippase family protein [Streptococcus sp. S784/96/1]
MKIFNIKISIEVKSAMAYTIATLFSSGIVILTVPIFTRIMSIEEIGTVNLFNSWYTLLSTIVGLSLTSGGYLIALEKFKTNQFAYISSVVSLATFVATIVLLMYLSNISFWNNVLNLPTDLVLLMIVSFMFFPARDFWIAKERYEYKYKLSAFIMFLSGILATVFPLILVLNKNIFGNISASSLRLYGSYLTLLLVSIIIWYYLIRKGKTFFNWEYWKFSLSLSLPLLGYSLSSQLLNVSDRIMIGKILGNASVGIYGTLYTASSLLALVWSALNTSFVPYLFKNIPNEDNRIAKVTSNLLLMYSLMALGVAYSVPELVSIFAPKEYLGAINIMPPIMAGVFYTSITNLYSNILVYYKKTAFVMYPALFAALLNIALNAVLISKFGMVAAAYTTLLSYVVMALVQYYYAYRVVRQQITVVKLYNDKILLLQSVVTTILIMISLPFYDKFIIRALIVLLVVSFILTKFIIDNLKNKKKECK